MLSFQRLDVYQRAIELLSEVYEIVHDLPRATPIARLNWSDLPSPWCETLLKAWVAGRESTVRVATRSCAGRRWSAASLVWCACVNSSPKLATCVGSRGWRYRRDAHPAGLPLFHRTGEATPKFLRELCQRCGV